MIFVKSDTMNGQLALVHTVLLTRANLGLCLPDTNQLGLAGVASFYISKAATHVSEAPCIWVTNSAVLSTAAVKGAVLAFKCL